ncbi:MAG: hypothetical protein WD342_16055 [Verrucomicrobiales bacterium]
MPERDPSILRSARWWAPDDQRSFGHRSRLKQMGFDTGDFRFLHHGPDTPEPDIF